VMVGPGEAPQPGGYAQRWKEILDSGSDVGRWELQAHSHPIDPATGVVSEVNMMPSGANGDMGVVYGESLASGQARSSTIHYTTADGPQQTAFGYAPQHPEPFWVDLPDGAGGRRELRFDSIDAYHDYMANTMKAPQGDVPAWFRPAQPAGEAGAAGESALSRAGERDLVPAAADRPVATVDPADNSVRVRVRGEIEDAIPRADAPGYEKYNEPGSAYGLDDYQRAHMYGPGFGDEVADGIMLAHKDVNLKLQNGAIEKAIRMLGRLAREEGGAVIVDVGVKSHPRVPGQPLLLRSAEYKVSFRRPDGTVVEAFEANIDEIGLPGTRSATNPEVSVTELEFARDNPELIEILQGGD
jgi:putative RNase toxin 4 of polymorphic toxin system